MLQKSIYIILFFLISSCYKVLKPELIECKPCLEIELYNNHFITSDFNLFMSVMDTSEFLEKNFKIGFENKDTLKIHWKQLRIYDTITEFGIDYSRNLYKLLDSENYILRDSFGNTIEKIRLEKTKFRPPIHQIARWDTYYNPKTKLTIYQHTIKGRIRIKF